jgi:hypothetical protein
MQKPMALLAGVLMALGLPTLALASEITFVNQTGATADFSIDGRYACRALSNLVCSSQTNAGSHALSVRLSDGRSQADNVDVGEGQSVSWTITEN